MQSIILSNTSLNSRAKQALYDNLDSDEELALKLDQIILDNKLDGWRNTGKKLRLSVNTILGDPDKTLEIMEIIKAQNEYSKVLKEWYRKELKKIMPGLIAKWEKVIGVKSNDWGVKQMKTKWGACNIEERRIWLNLELAKKPIICLEYIIVHELVHLLERNHNDRFIQYMNQFMPKWRLHRDELNSLPVAHNDWGY